MLRKHSFSSRNFRCTSVSPVTHHTGDNAQQDNYPRPTPAAAVVLTPTDGRALGPQPDKTTHIPTPTTYTEPPLTLEMILLSRDKTSDNAALATPGAAHKHTSHGAYSWFARLPSLGRARGKVTSPRGNTHTKTANPRGQAPIYGRFGWETRHGSSSRPRPLLCGLTQGHPRHPR